MITRGNAPKVSQKDGDRIDNLYEIKEGIVKALIENDKALLCAFHECGWDIEYYCDVLTAYGYKCKLSTGVSMFGKEVLLLEITWPEESGTRHQDFERDVEFAFKMSWNRG